jgi:hypothetical protein
MVRLYNERAARGQERAELAEQFADNMPRRGRLTWTIRRGEKRLAEIYARLGSDHSGGRLVGGPGWILAHVSLRYG